MSVLAELQKLIVERLTQDAGVSAMVARRVFDRVPPNAATPYIAFGAHDYVPADADCVAAGEHTLMLDVWSEAVGRVEAKRIVDAVRRALHGFSADMGDFGLAGINVDFADVLADPDGLTSHGRIQVRALIEEPE